MGRIGFLKLGLPQELLILVLIHRFIHPQTLQFLPHLFIISLQLFNLLLHLLIRSVYLECMIDLIMLLLDILVQLFDELVLPGYVLLIVRLLLGLQVLQLLDLLQVVARRGTYRLIALGG